MVLQCITTNHSQLTGEQHLGHVGDVSGWTASHRLKMGHPGETRWVCGASPCRWSHVCHMCHMLGLTVPSKGVDESSQNTILLLEEGTYMLRLRNSTLVQFGAEFAAADLGQIVQCLFAHLGQCILKVHSMNNHGHKYCEKKTTAKFR